MNRVCSLALCVFAAIALHAQPPMPTDSWPTYFGDFTGRRFSSLAKINDTNVTSLTLAWIYRMTSATEYRESAAWNAADVRRRNLFFRH